MFCTSPLSPSQRGKQFKLFYVLGAWDSYNGVKHPHKISREKLVRKSRSKSGVFSVGGEITKKRRKNICNNNNFLPFQPKGNTIQVPFLPLTAHKADLTFRLTVCQSTKIKKKSPLDWLAFRIFRGRREKTSSLLQHEKRQSNPICCLKRKDRDQQNHIICAIPTSFLNFKDHKATSNSVLSSDKISIPSTTITLISHNQFWSLYRLTFLHLLPPVQKHPPGNVDRPSLLQHNTRFSKWFRIIDKKPIQTISPVRIPRTVPPTATGGRWKRPRSPRARGGGSQGGRRGAGAEIWYNLKMQHLVNR